jgi:uncharacterized protein (DUF305 family)
MTRNRMAAAAALLAAGLGLGLAIGATVPAALAQMSHGGHGGHAGHAAADTPSTAAYREANERMHRDMDIAFTGDADVDFLKGMIPHHQGAIDMAGVVLAHGKDPAVRKLAEEIIAAQEKEIAQMRGWLKAKGH